MSSTCGPQIEPDTGAFVDERVESDPGAIKALVTEQGANSLLLLLRGVIYDHQADEVPEETPIRDRA